MQVSRCDEAGLLADRAPLVAAAAAVRRTRLRLALQQARQRGAHVSVAPAHGDWSRCQIVATTAPVWWGQRSPNAVARVTCGCPRGTLALHPRLAGARAASCWCTRCFLLVHALLAVVRATCWACVGPALTETVCRRRCTASALGRGRASTAGSLQTDTARHWVSKLRLQSARKEAQASAACTPGDAASLHAATRCICPDRAPTLAFGATVAALRRPACRAQLLEQLLQRPLAELRLSRFCAFLTRPRRPDAREVLVGGGPHRHPGGRVNNCEQVQLRQRLASALLDLWRARVGWLGRGEGRFEGCHATEGRNWDVMRIRGTLVGAIAGPLAGATGADQ